MAAESIGVASSTKRLPTRAIAAIALIGLVATSGIAVMKWFSRAEKQGPLLTYTVQPGDLDVTVTADGMLESSKNLEIKCMVKGGSTVLWVIETGTVVEPGDVLVELDTSVIEDNITQQQIALENALANKIIAESNVAVARTSIVEYLEGTYQEERYTLQKEIFDAQEAVRTALLEEKSGMRLAAKGMIRSLQLEGTRFGVESAKKDLELKEKRLEALEKYTKEKMLQELRSTLSAAEARLAADEASYALEVQRLEREKQQLENCTIRAEGSGMVIFPSAAEWKQTPDIEEGATVREQQTLLMIPDLDKMQVKVGIHESKVDRLRIGMPATIELQGSTLQGEVESIAEVTRPAGWWTGNMVEYDTIIKLEPRTGLKPGMSAIVDVVLAHHEDALSVPVATIVETEEGFFCWVETGDGVEKRAIELGDTNDEFTIVTAGLYAGDKVVLNPLAVIDDAKISIASGQLAQDAVEPATASEITNGKLTASSQTKRADKPAKQPSSVAKGKGQSSKSTARSPSKGE